MLHTFEINDEQEDFTRPWLENSDYADKIRFYIGDALELVPQLDLTLTLPSLTETSASTSIIMKWCSPAFPAVDISLPTIPCGMAMCWKNNPIAQTCRQSVSKPSMIWWRVDARVEKVILPLRDGLTIIRKK